MMKKILKTTGRFPFENLDYKICTTILTNQMQKTLDTIIGENQSTAIKNRTILHTISAIYDIIYVSNELNKNHSA